MWSNRVNACFLWDYDNDFRTHDIIIIISNTALATGWLSRWVFFFYRVRRNYQSVGYYNIIILVRLCVVKSMYRFRTDRLHRDNSKRQLQGKQKTVFLYCRFYFILFFWVGFFGELWLIDLWTHSEVVLPSYFIDVYTRVSRYTRVFYNRKNTLLYCTKNICLVHVFPFQAACLIRPLYTRYRRHIDI